MTPIILHIEFLLQYHECVILPGIGAFVSEYIPSRVDKESGIITPPSKNVNLNPAIRHDDGMLATSIARKEQISFEEARALLHREVNSIKTQLSLQKVYLLGKIGRLTISADDDKMEFIPFYSGFSRANSSGCPLTYMRCGVSPVAVTIPAANTETSTFDEQTENQSEQVAISQTAPANLPADCYLGVLSKKNFYLPINKIFARSVACLMILAAFALPFIMPQQTLIHEEVKASLNPVESLSAPRKASIERLDSLTTSSMKESDSVASAAGEPATDTDYHVEAPEGKYLIVATFHTGKEAEKYYAGKSTEAIPLKIVRDGKTWKISAAHGDAASLRTILNSSEFSKVYPKAWIWSAE